MIAFYIQVISEQRLLHLVREVKYSGSDPETLAFVSLKGH